MHGIRIMGKKYMKYSKCGIYYGYLVAGTSSSLFPGFHFPNYIHKDMNFHEFPHFGSE